MPIKPFSTILRPRSGIMLEPAVNENQGERGIVLLMVIFILSGLFVLALPLALLSRTNETASLHRLDEANARMLAAVALQQAKGRLRKGVYENEYYAAYPRPTASPTPTPSDIADATPYNSPFFDAPCEMYFDKAFDWDERFGKNAFNNHKGSVVSVTVEDEQGKLNVNSINPRILRGLYLTCMGFDPANMSSDEIQLLKDKFKYVIDPIAYYRILNESAYRKIISLDELRNVHHIDGNSYYSLSESEFDALSRHLTVHSWRLFQSGFSKFSQVSKISDSLREDGFFKLAFGEPCPVRVELLDKDKKSLSLCYLIPEYSTGNEYILTFPEDIPSEAEYFCTRREEIHPVNINTCSIETLTALIMAAIDLDDPKWTLEEAWEYVERGEIA